MDYFNEKQKFTQTWLWIILLISTLPAMVLISVGFYRQIHQGIPMGNNPVSDQTLLFLYPILMLVLLSVLILFLFSTLETRINSEGIHYRYIPFVNRWKLIPKTSIRDYEIKTYSPLMDYGGWGYRITISNGKALNVKGDQGLLIHYNNKKLLIGTQEREVLAEAMHKLMKPRQEEE